MPFLLFCARIPLYEIVSLPAVLCVCLHVGWKINGLFISAAVLFLQDRGQIGVQVAVVVTLAQC